MSRVRTNLFRAIALLGCFAVGGVFLTGCGGEKKEEDASKSSEKKDATDKMDKKAGGGEEKKEGENK